MLLALGRCLLRPGSSLMFSHLCFESTSRENSGPDAFERLLIKQTRTPPPSASPPRQPAKMLQMFLKMCFEWLHIITHFTSVQTNLTFIMVCSWFFFLDQKDLFPIFLSLMTSFLIIWPWSSEIEIRTCMRSQIHKGRWLHPFSFKSTQSDACDTAGPEQLLVAQTVGSYLLTVNSLETSELGPREGMQAFSVSMSVWGELSSGKNHQQLTGATCTFWQIYLSFYLL